MSRRDEILEAANADFESIALELFGNPTSRTRRELRFDAKGSWSIDLRKRAFFNYKTDTGGGIVALIAHWCGSREGAWEWLESRYGSRTTPPPIAKARPAKPVDDDAEEKAKHAKAAIRAQGDWGRARPCESHPYLEAKNVLSFGLRTLETRLGHALIVPAYDFAGNITSYQEIYAKRVMPTGNKKYLYGGDIYGRFFPIGAIDGAEIIAIAEGYATAATIHELTGWPVIVAFSAGGMKAVAEPLRQFAPGATLIFCGDHDAKSGTGQKAARESAQAVSGLVAIPPAPGDWNDYAASHGPQEARLKLREALPRPVFDLAAGQAAFARSLRAFILGRAAGHDPLTMGAPPAAAFFVTAGAGKSHEARTIMAKFVMDTGKAAILAVPTHKLGEEQLADFRALGVDAEIWRGMDRPDPLREGLTMCLDLDLSKPALDAGLKLSDVCKVCELHPKCGYQLQMGKRPKVWVVPHEMLFRTMSAPFKEAGLLVIDEDLRGTALAEGVKLAVSTLDGSPPAFLPAEEKKLLKSLRHLLDAGLSKATERRELRREDLEGLTAELIDDALSLENKAFAPVGLPQGSREALLAAIKQIRAAMPSPKVPLLWRLVRDFLQSDMERCPTIQILPGECLSEGNGTGRFVSMSYRRPIGQGWDILPKAILDATGDMRVILAMFPQAELLADIHIAAPHQHITRITGKSFAKASMVSTKDTSARDSRVRENTIIKLRQVIEVKAAEYAPATVGLICNKAVEELLGPLPGNVIVDHFNNTKGRNDWKDCAALLIVGRTKPNDDEVKRQARAFSGQWDCGDMEEAIGWQICQAELIQTIARTRGIRRTAENPVEIFLMNNIPLPVEIGAEVAWDDFQASPLDLLAARGLVIETDPQAAQMPKGYYGLVAAMLPDMFKNPHAARDGLKREIAYRGTLIGNSALKGWATAFAKVGTRGWLAVRIDPARLDAIGQVVELRDICLPTPEICEEADPAPIEDGDFGPIHIPPDLVPFPTGFWDCLDAPPAHPVDGGVSEAEPGER